MSAHKISVSWIELMNRLLKKPAGEDSDYLFCRLSRRREKSANRQQQPSPLMKRKFAVIRQCKMSLPQILIQLFPQVHSRQQGRQEPRIFTDATDSHGLSALI